MPAGAVGLEAFRVWNNRDQINQVQAFLETPEGNLPFSQDLIRFCDGTYRNLILVFAEEVTTFTHVELQFEMGLNPIYADWSRLTYNENLQLPENMDAPSLVISPSLPHVAMYDLVTESVYRKLWKITCTTKQGISQENAKKISKLLRDEGPKGVKCQIQGEELRISSKSRDDLQEAQRMIKEADYDFAVQFVNYR